MAQLHSVDCVIKTDLSVHVGKNLTIPCIKNRRHEVVLWTHEINTTELNVNVSIIQSTHNCRSD